MGSTEDIIVDALNEAVEQIRANLESTRTNSSGRTSASLEVEKYEGGARLWGRDNFASVEQGNQPGDREVGFVSIIRQWIDDKMKRGWFELKKPEGVSLEQAMSDAAYNIARSIQEYGSRLWNEGGRDDIYTVVLNNTVDSLQKEVASMFEIEATTFILTTPRNK